MATFLENMEARRLAISVELAALASTEAGGKPNAAGPNTVDHVGYKDGLYRELEGIKKAVADYLEGEALSAGPAEVITEGYV